MKFYRDNSEIRNNVNPMECDMGFKGPIVVGEFVNEEKPTFLDRYKEDILSGVSSG
jgi:hypothetical protein